jgi:hypothetical protein
MISFPCQLLHHVLYWLAYQGYNLASFSFSHKLQNFNPVSAMQVKQMKSGEKTNRKKLPGYNPAHQHDVSSCYFNLNTFSWEIFVMIRLKECDCKILQWSGKFYLFSVSNS